MTVSQTTLKNAAKAIGYDLWSDTDLATRKAIVRAAASIGANL